MEIIDEKGRLFGTVNVVDALVVLLVLAVGLAGVALVVSGGGGPVGPTETQYVTLDLGTQSEFLIEQIEVGDTGSLGGDTHGVTITDSYFTTSGGGTNAVVRVAVNQTGGGPFTVGGEPLRVGRSLEFVNESYALDNATVREVGNESALPTPERTVVLRGTVPNAVAADVSAGEAITVAGSRVATVREIATYSAENPDRQTLFLNATLRTYSTGDAVRFGGTRVEAGQSLTLPIAGYQFSGTIDRVGGGLDRTTEPVLTTGVVSADTANRIESGDTYQLSGQSVATVENVTAYDTDDPDEKRVYVGLSLQTLGYGDELRFGDQTVEEGVTLPFETETYDFDAEVLRMGMADFQPETESVIVASVVNADIARELDSGDTYEVAGRTVATVENVTAYDTDNPNRKRVYAGLSVQTLGYGEQLRFGTQAIEEGTTLPFRTQQYELSGDIIRTETADLQLESERVIVSDVVGAETARMLNEGDTYEVAGRTVATVKNVTAYDTDNPDRKRVYAGLSVQTLGYGEQLRFGTQAVEEGTTLPFRTQQYEFEGDILRLDTSDLQLTTEGVLVTDVVDVDVAQRIQGEDTYEVAGRTVATVENVAVYGTDDPDRKRVYVGLSVEALGYGELPLFGSDNPLREGSTLPFRTLAYEFTGDIVRLDGFQQPGQQTTRTVTLEMANVSPERADSVTAGLTETNAGQTFARVTNVNVTPAVITLTSESGDIFEREHPVNKDVTLTVELSVRESETGVRFKGRTIQEGNQVTLDLGVTTITATVTELDADDE